MTAANDYPWLAGWSNDPPYAAEAAKALAEIDALRTENARLADENAGLRDAALNRQPARIVWLETEVARLKAQLADARDADAALHDHITNGGRI